MEYEVFTKISARHIVATVDVTEDEAEVTAAWLVTELPENDHRPVRTPLALADLKPAEEDDLITEACAWWEDDNGNDDT